MKSSTLVTILSTVTVCYVLNLLLTPNCDTGAAERESRLRGEVAALAAGVRAADELAARLAAREQGAVAQELRGPAAAAAGGALERVDASATDASRTAATSASAAMVAPASASRSVPVDVGRGPDVSRRSAGSAPAPASRSVPVDVGRGPDVSRRAAGSAPAPLRTSVALVIVKPDLYDHGHTFGEFKMFTTLMWAAEALGCEVTLVQTRADAAKVKRGKGAVVVVSDQYTDKGLSHSVEATPASARFNVDFWGTPKEQVVRGTAVSQYVVPYPYPCGNTWIGYRTEDAAFRAAPPERKSKVVLVAGKELKYFTPAVRAMLKAVAASPDVDAVVTTIKDAKGRVPEGVDNRGLLDAAGYASLLGEAAVVLGLGDPVLGPNALDALEHGCVVVQLRYDRPRVEKWVNPRLPWKTQHDFAHAVGEPWVVSTTLDDYPRQVQRAMATHRENPVVRSRLPAAYSDAAVLDRARAWLEAASTPT